MVFFRVTLADNQHTSDRAMIIYLVKHSSLASKNVTPRMARNALGTISNASAQKIAALQRGDSFPHRADIAYTQSQAAMMASFGVPVSTAHISQTPSWEEQVDNSARGAVSDTILDGRLWNQFTSSTGCDPSTDASCKWVVPYYFADDADTTTRLSVTTAMGHIESKTCLKFQFLVNPTSSMYKNNKKLRIVTQTNLCMSYVGASYTNQDLFLSATTSANCGTDSAAVEHELLHSIGLYHENQRADAETILSFANFNDNIDPTLSQADINADYGFIPADNHLTFGSPYDLDSIMQLPSNKNGITLNGVVQDVFTKLDGSSVTNTAAELTDEDAWQINNLYGCDAFLRENMLECSSNNSHVLLADPATICDEVNENAGCPNGDNSDEANCDDCSQNLNGAENCASNAYCKVTADGDFDDCSCDIEDKDGGPVSGYMTGDGFTTASGGEGCSDVDECTDIQSCNVGTVEAPINLECKNLFPGKFDLRC